MKNITITQARKAAKALREFTGSEWKVLDWRDSGEGIRLYSDIEDPYWVSMQDVPGLPAGTFLEAGYGSLGLYYI